MKQLFITLFFLLSGAGAIFAQRAVSGTVTDEAGTPLIGANVIAKESSAVGTITDIDGNFKLQLPENVKTLVFSYAGYSNKDIEIGNSTVFNVVLSEGKILEEIVVTALGIKRDKSNLGYSVGQINSDELVTGRTSNVTNALVGKVAGIRTSGSGGSFTGSSVIVRGFTTFLGSNQPLYVVDGIPIDNSGGGTPLQQGSQLSNRAIDLNQDDIESISVLKGAGATTLYGSRGSAGVILITTKKGKKNQKNSISYSTNYAIQEVNRIPDYQNTYGQGTGGNFNATAISSWGPKIDGRKVTLPADYRAAGVGDSVALTAYPNNVADLFKKGSNMQHNLSFQGGNDKSAYRLSLGYLDDQGVLDNNRLKRYNVGLNASHDITDNLNAAISINYSTNGSVRTLQGNQLSNPLFRSWFTPRSWDLTGLPYKDANGNQLHYDPAVDNPRWTIYNNLNDDNTDRILGNFNLNYKLNSWLTANYKLGVDNFTFTRSSYDQIGIRGGGSTSNGPTGGIRERRDIVRNINSYLSFSARKQLDDDFEITAVVGQETINERRDNSDLIGRNLIIRNLRNLSTNTTSFTPFYEVLQRRILGVFGNVTTVYKNFATLDISLRNDWNSTLPKNNNSYLYYSAAGTINLTEAIPSLKSNSVNLLKLRGNYGRTGKGGDFLYATDSYYSSANPADGFGPNLIFPFNGLAGYTLNNSAGNPNLKPEFTTSLEFGLDMSLFDNRVQLDLTRYTQKTTDIIFNVPNSSAAGISSVFSNSGQLSTNGWEAALTLVPVKSTNFTWSSTFNYTKFISTVDKLAPGVQNIFLGGFTTPNIRLVEGDQFGQIYGNDYLRDDQGRLVLTAAGLPRPTANVVKLGNPNPKYTLGISNNFTLGNFRLSVLLDIRNGGDIYSRNVADLQRNGVTAETAEKDRFNSDGTVAKPYIFEGVLPNGTENKDSDPNAVRVTSEQYWGNSGKYVAARGFIYETSWFRVREVSFSYTFPKAALKNTLFGNLEIGVFGRNLFLSAPNYPHLDPEQNALGISSAQGLEFNALPQLRSYGANLRVTF
jgi:TonB-linked SusC/RagA family outer membrane protein